MTLSGVMAAAVSPFVKQTEAKGFPLRYQVDPDVPDVLFGDPERLCQILMNLFGNAVKFTEIGGVEGHVRLVEKSQETVVLHFQVLDTGIGIEEKHVEAIFNAFTQADGSLTRRFGGMGLGLSISKRLVEMMNGRIWVESSPGKGSCFHFTARFGIYEPGLASLKEENESFEFKGESERRPRKEFNILLVDDNKLNRQVGRDILEKLGYRVTTAESGKLGIDAFTTERFDLVLMDLEMPAMDGYEATRIIQQRAAESGLQVPIIALTAHVFEDVLQRCRDAGMEGHIAKPYSVAKLSQEIFRILEPEASGCGPISLPNELDQPKTYSGVILDMGKDLGEEPGNTHGKEMLLLKTPRHLLDQAFKKLDQLRMLIAAASPGQAAALLEQIKALARQLGAEALLDGIFRLQLMVRKEEWERCISQFLTIESELKHFEKQMTQEKATP